MLKQKVLKRNVQNFNIGNSNFKTYSYNDFRVLENGQYINLNGNSQIIDLNIKRISQYIHKKEVQKKNTYLKSIHQKQLSLKELKTRLNLIKKEYINELRHEYQKVINSNPISLYCEIPKGLSHIAITNKLKDYKIIKKSDDVGFYVVVNFYLKFKDSTIFKKLININHDINHFERLINYHNDLYKQLRDYELKINSYDLKLLDDGIISQNVKENLYYYLINFKKTNSFKITPELDLKLKITGLNLNELIEQVRHNIFKNSFKNILNDIEPFNKSLENNIINKYI